MGNFCFVQSSERFRKKSFLWEVKPSGTSGDSMRALSAYLVLVFVPHAVYSISQNACGDTQYNDAGNGCTYYTNCTVGQEISSQGTSTADRECKTCPIGMFSDTINSESCTPHSDCPIGQTLSVHATNGTDRTCINCQDNHYKSTTGQSKCIPWSDCPAGTRILSVGTISANRQCLTCSHGRYTDQANSNTCNKLWNECPQGKYVSTAATSKSDRVCIFCESGKFTAGFFNQHDCQDWRNCRVGTAITSEASTNKNRICGACPTGKFSEFQNSVACSPFSNDPDCEDWSQGNATYDRECLKRKPKPDVVIIWIVSLTSGLLIIATVYVIGVHIYHLNHPKQREKIKHMKKSMEKHGIFSSPNKGDVESPPIANPLGAKSSENDDLHHGTEVMVEANAGMLITVKSKATGRRGSHWDSLRTKVRNETYFHHPDLQKTVSQLVQAEREQKRKEKQTV